MKESSDGETMIAVSIWFQIRRKHTDTKTVKRRCPSDADAPVYLQQFTRTADYAISSGQNLQSSTTDSLLVSAVLSCRWCMYMQRFIFTHYLLHFNRQRQYD